MLRLKTEQINRYGYILGQKSNSYRRHQMVQSFLWMQFNKEKDNPGLNRQGLAKIVAQSFNRHAYTGRKRSWVKDRVIPRTIAGTTKHTLSWMEDENLVLSVREWGKRTGESKVNHQSLPINSIIK